MGNHVARILVACFGALLVVLSKPLGNMTASWQRMLGLETINETYNRVSYIVVGLIFVALALWAD